MTRHCPFRNERSVQSRWARLRRERLRRGPEHAREVERAFLGALITEPTMIQHAADRRRPAWFTDAGCLAVMRALVCLSPCAALSPLDVVDALRCHGDLDLAGGPGPIEALVEPRPLLHAALRELAEARSRLRPVDEEPIVRLAQSMFAADREARPCRADLT